MKACMGGWCRARDKCPHYMEVKRGADDSQRLCLPRQDGIRAMPAALGRVVLFNVFSGKEAA